MPAWGSRQSYPASVWATTLLAGAFALAAWLRPYIPDPEPNPVVVHRGQFMANASRQRIRWRALEDKPFAEARRTDRLVVLVVGCAWNWQARDFDNLVLMGTEIAERLNREFIPVRIDATIRPEWEPGPFPLGSASSGTDPGWYVLILRPDGQPLVFLSKEDVRQHIDGPSFQAMLSKAQGLKKRTSVETSAEFSRQASTEAMFLVGEPGDSGGDLGRYANGVSTTATANKPFLEGGVFRWHPWEWRFLIADNMTNEAETGIRALLTTTLYDWLHGGVFRTNAELAANGVRFEKLAMENADMACVFALLAQRTGDQDLKLVAERTFDGVFDQFVTSEKMFGFTYSYADAQGRNPRYSSSVRKLTNTFARADFPWLQDRLGLRAESNPAMIVKVRDLYDFAQNKSVYESVFARLRKGVSGKEPVVGGDDLANNVGGLCARLIEAARILGDKDRLAKALALYPRVAEYKAGPDGVAHSLKSSPDLVSYLGDYTAFADASLQKYLATGDLKALRSGEAVLLHATTLFGKQREGVIGTVPEGRAVPEAKWVALPSVVDGSQGSLVGDYVRLAQSYSLVLRDVDDGKKWRESALTTVAQYSVLTKKLNFRLGNLAHAMIHVARDQAVVVVGPACVQLAQEVSALVGDTLVIPAVGSVRKDVQTRGPGFYVCRQDEVVGPLTKNAALSAISGSP